MTVELNIDDRNHMLIAIISGDYDFEKVVKVIKMTLEKCVEKNLRRALIDMAQIVNADVPAIRNFVFSKDMASNWGKKVSMCIVYEHRFTTESREEAELGPGKWVMITANKNQSVFWLLAN